MTDSETGTEAEDVVDDATSAEAESGDPPGDTSGNEAEAAVEAEAHQGGAPTMTAPQSSQEQPPAATATKAGRKAHLTVSRVEPWSVMKFSFVVSLVCFIVLFVAVAVIYTILSALGVFDAMTELIASLTEGEDEEIQVNPETWFSPARVLGYTGLVGALNIILITALATVGSMLYNLAADLVGGIDVTLNEAE
ncbi:hypothetical protein F4561_006325 [Lipingzhangella halophila]|uniref:DUF3566 domain-containing protein n=1 Tax=Lipingzhangella halophila TaxID=1783352 RepID=A0A7W7W667_9ACTN|nr:hypothetical protein [Lipingzhangella halophila]